MKTWYVRMESGNWGYVEAYNKKEAVAKAEEQWGKKDGKVEYCETSERARRLSSKKLVDSLVAPFSAEDKDAEAGPKEGPPAMAQPLRSRRDYGASVRRVESSMMSRYEEILRRALAYMENDPDLEPTSALKQAAANAGIPYSSEMRRFVGWAQRKLDYMDMRRSPSRKARILTAGRSVLEYILQQSELAKLKGKVDEQTYELAVEVYQALSRALMLSPAQDEALGRLVQSADTMVWREDMHRNNIFKAAHVLGIRLPSATF